MFINAHSCIGLEPSPMIKICGQAWDTRYYLKTPPSIIIYIEENNLRGDIKGSAIILLDGNYCVTKVFLFTR